MKSLWLQMLAWFGLTFLVVSTLFLSVCGAMRILPAVLPTQSASDGSVQSRQTSLKQLVQLQIIYATIILFTFALVGWMFAKRAFAPIISLNDQLDAIDPNHLPAKVRISTGEPEFRELTDHINDLLARISLSFHQLQGYSAQVAHELRAPLTIIRLKIEQAADKIEPALAEEIQMELLRLTMHVEQSLLVARAEHGHLRLNRTRFDLASLLEDVTQDFRLLARDQNRGIEVQVARAEINADARYTRQILYSFLTNSLRHGRGTIYCELHDDSTSVMLMIRNRVKNEETDENIDLGLGRRIVAALAALHENMQLETKRGGGWYEVVLRIAKTPSDRLKIA